MAISEQQLATWAAVPSATEQNKMEVTHNAIELALKRYLPIDRLKMTYNLSDYKYEIYPQGSYANDTYIKFNSDVDIVVQLNSVEFHDVSELAEDQRQYYEKSFKLSDYKFVQFKKDVYDAMQSYFGKTQIEWGNKSVKLKASDTRVNADIIAAFRFKKYKWFYSVKDDMHHAIEGMQFIDTSNDTRILNYPKLHRLNMIIRDRLTGNRFKPMVRIVKNMKVRLLENNIITKKTASSYFIENLIYNATDNCFRGNYTYMMSNILQQWLDDITSNRITGYRCANGQDSLFFGVNSWNVPDATIFITEIGKLFLRA